MDDFTGFFTDILPNKVFTPSTGYWIRDNIVNEVGYGLKDSGVIDALKNAVSGFGH